MRKFADEINFKMELSPEKIKSLLAEGVAEKSNYIIAPVKINDDTKYTPYNPYNFSKFEFPSIKRKNMLFHYTLFSVYGKYESDLPQDMYLDIEEDPRNGGTHFTKNVRLKLLYYILKASRRLGGCDLEIGNLLFSQKITAFFPLHENHITNRIASNAVACGTSPWGFPFTQFRNYFGEKIGLYMVFLGHYSKWLIVPSIIGLIFQIVVWGTHNYSSPVLPFYAVVITVWAVMMTEYWKREEKSTAMIWGMIGFEQEEPDRPEFRGDLIKSYINGGELFYFSKQEFGERVAGSMAIIGGFILLLVGVVASIYVMRYALEKTLQGQASTVASICNTVQITIFNMVYQKVVVFLTDAENHRTDTEYEDSMTVKLFVFQFVNSYASFFFLAFIAQNLSASDPSSSSRGQCGAPSCMQPLSVNLAILFCTRIATGIVTNVVVPKIQSDMKRRSEGGAKNLTPPEMNYALMNYNTMIEGINNYADAALQFGFSILFVTALPLAPLMSLFANWTRVKGMAWKLCRLYQRPIPLGAEDIGTWMPIFQFVAVASVITNAGLVCFTMDGLDQFSNWGRVWVFIGFQWVLIGMQFMIQCFVPDEPEEVTIQMKRSEFICSKVIDRTPDEDPMSIEAYESAERQSLAQFALDSVDKGCWNALCGRGEKKSSMKELKFTVTKDIDVNQYPSGSTGFGTSHNPMGGY